MPDIQKITPNLWFDGNAHEAAEYYVSVFADNRTGSGAHSRIVSTAYYPKSSDEGLADFQQDLAGKVLTVEFELAGLRFVGINAGPEFKFSEAVSFSIACADQAEIDYFWDKLSKQPENEQCGWCKDQFGLSWQVVPANMEELMRKPDAFAKMMQMKKLVIEDF